MIRRKAMLCMCSVFISIEVILLIEQQIIIFKRDAVQEAIDYKVRTEKCGLVLRLTVLNLMGIMKAGVTIWRDSKKLCVLVRYLRKYLNLVIRDDIFQDRPTVVIDIDHSVIGIIEQSTTTSNYKTLSIQKYFVKETLVAKSIKKLKKKRNKTRLKHTTKDPVLNTTNLFMDHASKPLFSNDYRNKRRLDQIRHYCEVNYVEGNVDRVLVNPQKTMSYCVSHKVASTHWLRVFRFLWNDTMKGHVSSPSEISKMEAHFPKKSKMKEFSFKGLFERQLISNTSRFMFVREPFVRLWSVFIDKFVLADNYFWSYHGPKIARVNNLQVLPARKPCYNFSFKHFINYVITSSHDYNTMDDHIKPISRLCNPCLLKPDFVGKVETMKDDNKEVLNVLGVKWGDGDESVSRDQIYDEMKTIIDFNYYIVKTLHLLTACLNSVKIGERILSAFVLNGYIPESADKHLRNNLPSTKEELLDMMWKAYHSSNRTHKSVKEQRNRLRQNAFQLIPLDSMHELQRIYYDDFNLFDYRLDPPEIFYNKSVNM